jgi:hypothetical protein
MFFTARSSTAIKSKRRTQAVVVFSIQSRRRSASVARTLAMADLVLARRFEPFCWRASRRCNRRSRCCSARRRQGAW